MQSEGTQGGEYLDVLEAEGDACILTEAHLVAQGDKTPFLVSFPIAFPTTWSMKSTSFWKLPFHLSPAVL